MNTTPESSQSRTQTSVTLTGTGVTLLGVLLSIGVTVAGALSGPWWLRIAIGAACTASLTLLVKLTSRTGRGPLARLANWAISAPRDGK